MLLSGGRQRKVAPLRSWLRSEPGPEGAPSASGLLVAPNLAAGELTDLLASNMLDQLAAAAEIDVFQAHDFNWFEFREEPVQVFIIGD